MPILILYSISVEYDCRVALSLFEQGTPYNKEEIGLPNINRLRYMRHVALCVLGHYQESLDEFAKIDISYLSRIHYHYSGIAKYHLGRYDEALKHLNQIEQHYDRPSITDIHAYIAAIEANAVTQNKVVSGEASWMNKLRVLKQPLIFKRTDDPDIA